MNEISTVEFEVDRFQSLLLDLPETSVEDYMYDSGQKKFSWAAPPVYSDDVKLAKPDIWHLVGTATLVMNRNCADLLRPYLAWWGELLPLPSEIDDFVLLNLTRTMNCLDESRSEFERVPPVFTFIDHRLGEPGLFKAPPFETVYIFDLDRGDEFGRSLKGLVNDFGLTGIRFEPVWSSQKGAIRRGIDWFGQGL